MPRDLMLSAWQVCVGDLFDGHEVTDVRFSDDDSLVTLYTATAVTALPSDYVVEIEAAH